MSSETKCIPYKARVFSHAHALPPLQRRENDFLGLCISRLVLSVTYVLR